MLATFNGTNSPDTIVIISSGTGTIVTINGGTPQNTADATIVINALGGNDIVYFPMLRVGTGLSPKDITLNLGEGDDFATNFNPSTGLASFHDINFGLRVVGEGGNDTLSLDNSNELDDNNFNTFNYRSFVLDTSTEGASRVFLSHNSTPFPEFRYGTTLENLTIDGSAFDDSFVMKEKLPGLRVTANGRGGNDRFFGGSYTPPGVIPPFNPAIAFNFSDSATGWRDGTTTLNGGSGIDAITFEDRAATQGQYILNATTITKGGGGFTYGSIETQTLRGARFSEMFVNATAGSITNTLLYGNNSVVNIGNGTLNNISGTTDVHIEETGSAVNVFDGDDTGNDNYTVSAIDSFSGRLEKNPFVASQIINFHGTQNFRLDASNDANGITVISTRNFGLIDINAGGGNDMIRLGNGNLDVNLPTSIKVDGGAGNDEVYFNNTADPTAASQTLDGLAFTDGVTHTSTNVESMLIQNGGGGGTFNLLRATTYTNFIGGTFNQTVNIGNGNLDANILADVEIGIAGNVTLDDRQDTGTDGYTVNATTFRKTTPGAPTINLNNVQAAILQANDGHNVIDVLQGAANLQIFANGGNDQINVADTAFIFTVNTISIDTGPEVFSPVFPSGDYVVVNSDAATGGDVGAAVKLLANDAIVGLTVNSGGTFRVPSGVTYQSQDIQNAGVIDLAGGSILTKAGTSASNNVSAWLSRGYADGAWNGTHPAGAINSSLAAASTASDGVGFGTGAQVAISSSGSFNISQFDVLTRFTLNGDADLDRQVNLNDFTRLAAGFGSGTAWVQGDTNYDASVNLDDFTVLAGNFGTSTASDLPRTNQSTKAKLPRIQSAGAIFSNALFPSRSPEWQTDSWKEMDGQAVNLP